MKCDFLCEKGAREDDGDLHQVCTFETDANIITIITELNDSRLLVRIVGGDLIAIGAKYHLKCLIELKNRYRSHLRKSNKDMQNIDENVCNSRVFVEFAIYVKKEGSSEKLLFKLSEVHSLYESCLEDLGNAKSVNKTRLKEHLLEYFKETQEQFDGRHTFLVFKEGMRNMIQDALKKRDFSEDALILARAASIIRKDIFNHEGILFNGSFPEKFQDTSLPSSLKTLTSLILNGSNSKNQEKQESQACLTIGQAIIFNAKKRSTADPEAKPRHLLEREPPLPVYIGLNLINQLHQLGICISYERVLQLEDWIAKAICIRFDEDGVVFPVCLHRGLFTVGALDNPDHNPSSTTSQSSFHGIGISMFQFPSPKNPVECRPP